ncbi:excalibur calcium-binding domain-containing protein [Amycolatopsis carbonis]|uniref:Excalibur calcium-binding domain-containing protein n=1 Tax=Amycolatopsis carbonis TaxID=715471 RepID=A0A9Y2ILJ4_9PSEU|nr:excalibur calcium-binding domain-containing protein [Amycolatopsis sp. 2-15]WIX80548.1 excalibur calcium-binding domain-containing protein [Amycolatopsis sp. 2-15]
MHPTPAPAARPRKRFPKWLMVTLGVFVVLFVLGAIFGKAPETPTQPVAAPAAPTTTTPATPTTSTPPPVTYTVDKVVDGATVELAASDGTHRTVHVLGVTVATGSNCYATETLTWATSKLAGAAVKLTTDTTTGVALALADGSDYATAAVQNGYAKFAVDATSTALQAAETTARQAATGLWAAPCKGAIDAPTPQAPAPPAPPATKQKEAPAPPRTHEDPPPVEEPDTSSAYYQNCTEARAAGVTPLHVGDPGYSRKLDRDGDGVACE